MKHNESRLQKMIVQHLFMNGAFYFSIPNEGRRSVVMGAHLKQMGLIPGAADLCVIVDGKAHFMEVKDKDGVLSAKQCDFSTRCLLEKIPYACVYSLSQALEVLSAWRAIRPVKVAA